MNFEILTPRFREMVTLNYFVNSIEVWSHTPLGMSCDLIKILVISRKRLWCISINFFLNTDDAILNLYYTQVCAKKQNVLCLEHCTQSTLTWGMFSQVVVSDLKFLLHLWCLQVINWQLVTAVFCVFFISTGRSSGIITQQVKETLPLFLCRYKFAIFHPSLPGLTLWKSQRYTFTPRKLDSRARSLASE